jgi:glycosidase
MRIIVDLVVNHTSAGHPWFRASASSPSSPKRDWYIWRTDDPGWTQPWSNEPVWHASGDAFYYGLFWGGMPDLNFRTPAVREEIKRIAKLWLDRGVDGFRLDAAKYLVEGPEGQQSDVPETHAFWKEFSAYVRSIRPDAVLVGEVWSSLDSIAPYYGDTSVVAGGDELPMNFNFGIGGAIIAAVRDGRASEVYSALRTRQRVLPRGVIDATFLTNHDQARIASQLDGDPARLRAAASVLLTIPGAPFLYYGEEVGLRNAGDGFGSRGGPGAADEDKRSPMHWDGTPNAGFTTGHPWAPLSGGLETVNVAAQTKDPASVLSRYRELIALRHRSAALRAGELELVRPQGGVLAFLAKTTGETVLVVHNVGAAAATAGPLQLPAGKPVALLADPGVGAPASGPEGWSVQMPPFSTGVWRIHLAAARASLPQPPSHRVAGAERPGGSSRARPARRVRAAP